MSVSLKGKLQDGRKFSHLHPMTTHAVWDQIGEEDVREAKQTKISTEKTMCGWREAEQLVLRALAEHG